MNWKLEIGPPGEKADFISYYETFEEAKQRAEQEKEYFQRVSSTCALGELVVKGDLTKNRKYYVIDDKGKGQRKIWQEIRIIKV